MAAASECICVTDRSKVGEARRAAIEVAQQAVDDEEFVARVGIIASEAAHNLLAHCDGGMVVLRRLSSYEGEGIDLLALDSGPGIQNVAECLRDGYSTGGTAGQGLGAIQRLSTAFEIYSRKGAGTALWSRSLFKSPSSPPVPAFQLGAVNVALSPEPVSGDAWEILQAEGRTRLVVADGLGHGMYASEASQAALQVFREMPSRALSEVLATMHEQLKPTRGAAVSLLDRTHDGLTACGLGNVAMRAIHEGQVQHFVIHRGTVGAAIRQPQEFKFPTKPGTLTILHSDGIATQWNLDTYPGLESRHPALIAGVLFRDFRRERDDATVLVVRF